MNMLAITEALVALEGFAGRMTAKEQRAVFGYVPFGKKWFRVVTTENGREVRYKTQTSGNGDYDIYTVKAVEFVRKAAVQTPLDLMRAR